MEGLDIFGGGQRRSALVAIVIVIAVLAIYWYVMHSHKMARIRPTPVMPPVRPHTRSRFGSGAGQCGPGEAAVTYREPDGTASSFCRSFNDEPGPPTVCGAGWDPAASAEAQALATVGSYQHRAYGEPRLMGAIDAAFDANLGLSDAQLATLVQQSNMP